MSLSRAMKTTDVITNLSSNCMYRKKKKNNSFVRYNLSRKLHMSAGDGFSCCHDCVLGTGQLCCAVISFTFITNKSVLCHSFTPVFCLYESVHVHNEMHFISLTAFIWEVKFSLILQTTPCSFKVQSISHNNSASI